MKEKEYGQLRGGGCERGSGKWEDEDMVWNGIDF